jgi:hypothetical protein
MDGSELNQRSCASPRASPRRVATLTVPGFTAGGSGTVSAEAIASHRPRTEIMHDLDFISCLHPDVNDNRISGVALLRRARASSSAQGSGGMGEHFSGNAGFADH